MNHKASVVIVERLPLVSEAFARMLEDLGGDVVARSPTWEAGLEYLETLSPGLAVVDRDVLDQNLPAAIRAAAEASPQTRMVLLFAHASWPEMRCAEQTGTCECLLKTESVGFLRWTFDRLLSEVPAPSAPVARQAGAGVNGTVPKSKRSEGLARLTERELEVLPYLARGLTVDETSQIMCMSLKTVDAYKTSLMAKLGIHNRITLTRFAIQAGLIPVWED